MENWRERGRGEKLVGLIKGLCLHLQSMFKVWAALETAATVTSVLSLSLYSLWPNRGFSVCVEPSSISFTSIRLFRGNHSLNLYFGRSFMGPDFLSSSLSLPLFLFFFSLLTLFDVSCLLQFNSWLLANPNSPLPLLKRKERKVTGHCN